MRHDVANRDSGCGSALRAKQLKRQQRAPWWERFEHALAARAGGRICKERREKAKPVKCRIDETGLRHRIENDAAAHLDDAAIAFPGHARCRKDLEIVERIV